MQALDDMALLREYAACNSEAAFEALVSRRVGFVYAAALRQVRDPHLAEEVTQAVFIILARKAGKLRHGTILSGWLFKTIRFAAIAQIRTAMRRRQHEQEAQMQSENQPGAPDPLWDQMAPLLDEALLQLGEKDRQAILLRFFESKSLAEVGNSLGAGEDGARMRISRALEKMRRYFMKRGVASTVDLIAGAISANSLQAAPAALTKSVIAVAMGKGASAGSSTLTFVKGALKLMAWTKAKTAIVIGAAVIFAAGTVSVIIEKAGAHLKPSSVVNRFSDISAHISPFTGVRFEGDTVTVTYDGAEYQLAAINSISTQEMLDFCRREYKDSWQKRFAEDLVVVLSDMGRPITAEHTVNLTLVDSKTGETQQIKNAAMTEENRQAIHESFKPALQ